jgi:hypothetical protein
MSIAAGLALLLARPAGADPAAATNAAPAATAAQPPVVGVHDFLHNPHAYAGQKIILRGFVTDVCRRKGCWALLHDSDPDATGPIRVQQDEDGDTFKAFLPELQGKTIQVTGDVKQTKIDNAYLDQWEANVRAAQEKNAPPGTVDSKKDAAYQAALKQIAGLRERVAKSPHGSLSSYSVAVSQWEEQADKP